MKNWPGRPKNTAAHQGTQPHRRLLHLINQIGAEQSYSADVIWVAAHLHDWGGWGTWLLAGVDHAARSKEVAAEYLAARDRPPDFAAHVLECIEYHHSPDPARSIEAILLCDADALDFLGVVGVLRDFSKNAKDLRKACAITRKRRFRQTAGRADSGCVQIAGGGPDSTHG